MMEQGSLFVDDANAKRAQTTYWDLVKVLEEADIPVHRHGDMTEFIAAKKVTRAAPSLRVAVLWALATAGDEGMIGHDAVHLLGVGESTARTRLTELGKMGLAIKTGRTRNNPRGNPEGVWRATREVISAVEALTSEDEEVEG
jgi:hypothetical protein